MCAWMCKTLLPQLSENKSSLCELAPLLLRLQSLSLFLIFLVLQPGQASSQETDANHCEKLQGKQVHLWCALVFLQCTAVSYLSCFLELSALLSFSVFVLPTMLIFQVSYGFAHANLLSDSASLVSLIVWVFHCRSSNSIFPHRLATVFRGSLHFLAVSFQHFRKAWTLTVLFFRRARLRGRSVGSRGDQEGGDLLLQSPFRKIHQS